MGIHVEWADASSPVNWIKPGQIDDSNGTPNTKPALVVDYDDAFVIEGDKEELVAFAKRMLAAAEAIDWVFVPVEHMINLHDRNVEQGYIDSIKLIHDVLVEQYPDEKDDFDSEHAYDTEAIAAAGDEGMTELLSGVLAEWEERAADHNLTAYSDGESGVYRVTNQPEED